MLSGTEKDGISYQGEVDAGHVAAQTTVARRGRWREACYGVAVLITSLLLCLLVIELAGRAFGLLPAPSRAFRFSPTKGYELAPGHEDINAYGLRDREYPLAKPPHTFRILAIGDSFTFGAGVLREEAYTERLEVMLNERLQRSGMRFEVLNAGVPGYNTSQELVHLRESGLRFDPDLIIVGFTLGDAELGTLGLKDAKNQIGLIRVKEWVKNHFALYGFLRLRLNRLLDRLHAARSGGEIGGSAVIPLRRAAKGEEDAAWQRCRRSLHDIAAVARARNIPVVLVIFPLLVNLDETYPFRAEHALVAATGRESGAVILDLLPEFLGLDPATLWVAPTDSHPNARGHAIAAEAMYRALLSHGLIPVAPSPTGEARPSDEP